jgi:hypothetical protein
MHNNNKLVIQTFCTSLIVEPDRSIEVAFAQSLVAYGTRDIQPRSFQILKKNTNFKFHVVALG